MTDNTGKLSPCPASANILVTGGAGFIGSNFIRYALEKTGFVGNIVNYDKLTYAGNLLNIVDMEERFGGRRYFFEKGDILDFGRLEEVFNKYSISVVVHFAAESHVDRSIFGPGDFVATNISGTFSLLEAARMYWSGKRDVRFHHISTDEVYGSLGQTGYFFETTPYDPRSPYSASKAASDHLVRAYFHTYDLPVTISNCSNNYGPYHFPEKLIPLIILNAIEGKPLPVYGDGRNVRDWLYVGDHCSAIWRILEAGKAGETYNIGGGCERENIEVVHAICDMLEDLCTLENNAEAREQNPGFAHYRDLITFVTDRPGHDRRYAINCDKLSDELGWKPQEEFETGIRRTIKWYLHNRKWVQSVRSGQYQEWIETNYSKRT